MKYFIMHLAIAGLYTSDSCLILNVFFSLQLAIVFSGRTFPVELAGRQLLLLLFFICTAKVDGPPRR